MHRVPSDSTSPLATRHRTRCFPTRTLASCFFLSPSRPRAILCRVASSSPQLRSRNAHTLLHLQSRRFIVSFFVLDRAHRLRGRRPGWIVPLSAEELTVTGVLRFESVQRGASLSYPRPPRPICRSPSPRLPHSFPATKMPRSGSDRRTEPDPTIILRDLLPRNLAIRDLAGESTACARSTPARRTPLSFYTLPALIYRFCRTLINLNFSRGVLFVEQFFFSHYDAAARYSSCAR